MILDVDSAVFILEESKEKGASGMLMLDKAGVLQVKQTI